ncbi:MAG: hypothetical protein R3F19_00200 [Verrucomicrobiales bacterium]
MFNKAGVPCMYDDPHLPGATHHRAHTGTSIMMMAGYGSVFMESQFEDGDKGAVFNYDITYDPRAPPEGSKGQSRPALFSTSVQTCAIWATARKPTAEFSRCALAIAATTTRG